LQTTSTVVVSNTAVTSPANAVSVVQSWYDPQAEFLEVATVVNDVLSFKTYGPDASGTYGALNGVGGLGRPQYLWPHHHAGRGAGHFWQRAGFHQQQVPSPGTPRG
jgi:hypothetical protein